MVRLYYILFTITLLSVSCGKKDITKNVTVSGNVRNNCTGGPFAGVKVKFTTTHEKSFGKTKTSTLTSVTDNIGDFSFNNLEINNNNKYFMSIDTYSNYDYEFFGISPQELDKNQISTPYQIGVSASFKALTIQLPQGVTVSSPDSFNILLEQKTLHKYEPSRIWQIPYDYGTIHNYPMGWWHITLNKTKSGVNSVFMIVYMLIWAVLQLILYLGKGFFYSRPSRIDHCS